MKCVFGRAKIVLYAYSDAKQIGYDDICCLTSFHV